MRVLYNTPVRTVYSRGLTEFAVGVEVEMEVADRGVEFPIRNTGGKAKFWALKGDGSLRNNGHEAVSKPLSYNEIKPALVELDQLIDFSKLDKKSPRTSVHVHVNMGDKTLAQVVNIVCVYTLFEDLLLELSGKTRKGNNFALSTQAAEGFLDSIRQSIKDNERIVFGENDRYASLNLACLRQFGTVEFRSMRGLTDTSEMEEWTEVIKSIYDVAVAYPHPKALMSTGVEQLIPLALLNYFTRDRIIEVANSNLSSVLSIVYCHKTDWDFDDPECDIRCNNEFFEWWKDKGYTVRDMMVSSTRDLESSFKKFQITKNLKTPDLEATANGQMQAEQIRLNLEADENFWVVNDDIEVI